MDECRGVPREDHEALYAEYLESLKVTHPKLRIIPKDESLFNRVIDRVLRILTFGKQNSYMTDFTTTLGNRIYVPYSWRYTSAAERYCTMRHEVVHVRQFRRFTWPGIALLYLLVPLPAVFAMGRAGIELEAYRESLRATWQVYGAAAAKSETLMNHIVQRFTGPDYGWMWVHGKSVRRALEKTLRELEACPPARLVVVGSRSRPVA